ncbi:unnamed protein product, partial [Schistocephalus solidus]|uniref:Vigilin n=1 Tax=Schistocephalus solidus TaxID=70667 RepID=A0A183SY16_SCHSO
SIEIKWEERRQQGSGGADGVPLEAAKVCANVARATGVKIEIANSKMNSLNIFLTGSKGDVAHAKRLVAQELQQQATKTIKVPPEYHRFLIGRNGERKRQLEADTMTRITVPPPNKNSNEITLTGPVAYLDAAEKEVRRIVDYHAQQAYEKLDIPRIYHPFIRGPGNKFVNEWRERAGVIISFPPGDHVTVSGKRKEVALAVQEISKIHKSRADRCTTIPAVIQRDKHRMVLGARNSGIQEILEETNVSLEPPVDSDSDEFTLRGFPEDLGRALTMVYKRASSSTTEEVSAPQRLHRILIGKKGASLTSIREGYEAVRIDFQNNSDKILVEGPPEEVTVIVDRLKTRINQLSTSFYVESVRVDSKFHDKLLGTQGKIMQIIRSNRYDVRLPSGTEVGKPEDANVVYLEGEEYNVKAVKAEIERLIEKLENEKTKDIIVDPRIQKLLRSGNPPPIRQIEESFPEVKILWPDVSGPRRKNTDAADSSSTSFIVQLNGVRDQVDAASERLNKLIKQVKEENYEQEIRLFKDCLQRLLGATIVRLLEETKTRIHYTPASADGSQVVVIIGRQENVETAVQRIEHLQKSLTSIEEITVQLPSLLLSKFADSPAARLRSIREQCEGVQLKTSRAQPRQLVISGPPEALAKAKSLIDSMCAKMMERCADVSCACIANILTHRFPEHAFLRITVYADPKFHGHLIGRGGANLTRFREKHNVEIIFPDRCEGDPKLASEIHIIGEKEAVSKAQKEFEQMIKTMEDEVEATVELDSSLIREMLNYRACFNYPELERVKVVWPKVPGASSPGNAARRYQKEQSENQQERPEGNVSIRLFGAKACVEAAQQCLENMVSDLKCQTVVKHPITEASHCQILGKCRSGLGDIQRNYNVLITFQFSPVVKGEVNTEKEDIYGYIVLTGRPERIEAALKNELLPLLPVTETYEFPQEFHGKLFAVDQPRPTGKQKFHKHIPNQNGRNSKESEATTTTQFDGHMTKLMELQTKFDVSCRILFSVQLLFIKAYILALQVSLQLPQRSLRGANYVKIRGSPDHIESVKAELDTLRKVYEEEKADWVARSYTETLPVEERFVMRIMNEKDRLYKSHGVVIHVKSSPRQPPAAAEKPGATEVAPKEPEGTQKEHPDGQQLSSETDLSEETHTASAKDETEPRTSAVSQPSLSGYRLVKTSSTSLVLQGYKEKVEAARKELEALLEKCATFVCEQLHIPSKIHPRLIGTRRYQIHRLEEAYSVDVEFPPRGTTGEAADIVLVMGDPSDVDVACDELINRANDLVCIGIHFLYNLCSVFLTFSVGVGELQVMLSHVPDHLAAFTSTSGGKYKHPSAAIAKIGGASRLHSLASEGVVQQEGMFRRGSQKKETVIVTATETMGIQYSLPYNIVCPAAGVEDANDNQFVEILHKR